MEQNYIAFAIPVFFLFIGLELIVAKFQGKQLYRLNDAITDISCGMVQQVVEALLKTALFGGYYWMWNHFRILELNPQSVGVWLLCFTLIDFIYYWFHRICHHVNFLWAAHSVHHQSEDFNFAVALRQSAIQGLFNWVFYVPLAILGFPPVMFFTLVAINLLYQFFIHTCTINRLGFLELFMNTPSHHRVHHGIQPKYIDKNHAGVFIIWDKLFGTFQQEEELPLYGVTVPLKSWDPIWANLDYWALILRNAKGAHGLKNKILMFLKPPGWNPETGVRLACEIDLVSYRKFDFDYSPSLVPYLLLQFGLLVV